MIVTVFRASNAEVSVQVAFENAVNDAQCTMHTCKTAVKMNIIIMRLYVSHGCKTK